MAKGFHFKIGLTLGLLILLTGYQNCAEHGFQGETTELASLSGSVSGDSLIPAEYLQTQNESQFPSGNTVSGVQPKIILSKTLNGSPTNSFKETDLVFGRITDIGIANVISCAEPVSSSNCQNKANWVPFPNSDWKISGNEFRMAGDFKNIGPGTFNMYVENTETGAAIATSLTVSPVAAQVQPAAPSCQWSYPVVIGPCPGPSQSQLGSCSQANNGQSKYIAGPGGCGGNYTCNCN